MILKYIKPLRLQGEQVKKALIDGDTIIFKVAVTHQDDFSWDEDSEDDSYFDYQLACRTLHKELKAILDKVKCREYEFHLTGSNNFRHTLGDYKQNRKDKVLPVGLQPLRQYAMENLTAFMAEGMEADDVVVYKKNHFPDDYVLCAIDKDVLYQSVGKHYNYNTGETVRVTAEEANRYMYFQVLTGDTTDGYKGCYKIGKVKAAQMLEANPEDYEMIVAKAYKKAGHDYDYMLSQYRMASMNQYNGELHEIVLHELKLTKEDYDGIKA